MPAARRRKRKETCTYCGCSGAGTRDHVPPKGLFPADQRSGLLTVPCCDDCRLRTGIDDEYFKIVLSFRYEIGEGPTGDAVRSSAERAISRPEKRKFLKDLASQMRSAEVTSPAGVFLGRRAIYPVELRRLNNVLQRTVRGLYRVCSGTVLPLDVTVVTIPREMMPNAGPSAVHWVSHTEPFLESMPDHVIGDGAFSYKHTMLDDTDYVSTWLLRFYGRVDFLGFTARDHV